MKFLTVLSILFFSLSVNAQNYRVYFTDKGENAGMLQNPYSFLSPEAIENKALRNTVIDMADVPVSKEYLKSLRDLDLKVEVKSRWFNYALLSGEDVLEKIGGLPFVKKVEQARKYEVYHAREQAVQGTSMLVYGASKKQIEQVNGNYLHDLGQLGHGMTIAVIDGGFSGTNTVIGLDSLRKSGRLLGGFNFIENDTNVFKDGGHGTDVLSIMAGYVDSLFVGSGIAANYWLLKSENQSSETAIEMDYWLAAAEFADSVGADIISSSLGYNIFQDGVGDLAYEDLDGNTALVTRAADMAAKKGLLVITSAGNEGNGSWKYILAPADGDSVLTIGGVDEFGNYATFASQGPTADGRIKPTVSARAVGTAYLGVQIANGNGTSFSCPIISGLAACLWQEFPGKTNMEIYEAIRSTASHSFHPNNEIGFGIANFASASWTISAPEQTRDVFSIEVFPNPIGQEFSVGLTGMAKAENITVQILDVTGRQVAEASFKQIVNQELKIQADLASGSYLLHITVGEKVYLKKIIK